MCPFNLFWLSTTSAHSTSLSFEVCSSPALRYVSIFIMVNRPDLSVWRQTSSPSLHLVLRLFNSIFSCLVRFDSCSPVSFQFFSVYLSNQSNHSSLITANFSSSLGVRGFARITLELFLASVTICLPQSKRYRISRPF